MSTTAGAPVTTAAVEAFTVAAYPVAAADICSPASCLVNVKDTTLHDLAVVKMLITRGAVAAVRVVSVAVEVAKWAWRSTLRTHLL